MIVTSIFTRVYQSLVNFFILLFAALNKILCSCKSSKKKLKRSESGYLDILDRGKLSVVIDLDNTLIYSTVNKIEKAKNYAIMNNKFYVYKRPHLDSFLTTLSQYCELSIYTAGTKEYAERIIDYIDKNRLIKTRYYRENCVFQGNNWYKDVSKYGYDERKVLIIDDMPKCHLTYRCKNKLTIFYQ
jgi:Dullard-like phosphatase family protein